MLTTTAETKPCKKMHLYFTLEFRSSVNLFSIRLSVSKLAQAKHTSIALNSKRRYKKLAIAVRVL